MDEDLQRVMKRRLGLVVLLTLASVSVVLALVTYGQGIRSGKVLLFDAAVAAFGLYALGSFFFDYPVTFRTTIKPWDALSLRVFQVATGLFIWGASCWSLLKY